MRRRPARAIGVVGVALVGALGACGRIGYDELGGDDVPGDYVDTPCDTPVMIADYGAALTPAPAPHALDVTATTTGFVAIWYAGGADLESTGIAVDGTNRVAVIQSAGYVAAATGDFSVAALGDRVVLAVDDGGNDRLAFVDLSEYGYSRGATAYQPSKRGFGHGFITADAGRDQFVIAGVNGTSTYAFTIDHDGDPVAAPIEVIAGNAETPEGTSAVVHGGGYAVIAGTVNECTVVPVDDAMAARAAPSVIAMTCHNPGLVSAPGSSSVVAAWNCDNDAVWTTGGDPTSPLPGEHAVFGDGSMSSSDPRVTVTSAGVWYVYRVAGGRLGRALLDGAGDPVARGAPRDVYASIDVVAHDLVSRGDEAFLFWLESSANDRLWAMRLCPP